MRVPVALQLYSLRELVAKDFSGTLRMVKEAGYDAVEFANDFGGRTAEQLKQELADIGLLPLSAHIGLHSLQNNLEATAQFYKTLEMPFVNCSGSTVESRERVASSRAILCNAARRFQADGTLFGYHNHWAEFEVRDGCYILETLLAPDSEAVLHAQLDYCWVAHQDVDPAAYTRKWGNRLTPPHFKDLNADYKNRQPTEMTAEVGNGIIDFPAVLFAMREAGTLGRGIVVEQEAFDKDPLDAVAISVGNIKNWLQGL